MSDRALTGRTALVTGSLGGLGLTMACSLASAGATVILSGLDSPEEAESTRRAIADISDADVHYLRADLAHVDQVRMVVNQAAEIGAIDILVNNAVVRHFAPIRDFPIDRWNEALAVNLTAALVATQLAIPSMLDRNFGRIFNMTSVYGSRAVANRVDYVTTKTALQGMTRAIALEVAGSGVSCHALTPGSVLTPVWQERVEEMMRVEGIDRAAAERRFLDGKQPSGRFVAAESVAALMLLLCGPVGEDMNGAILPIEGGWLARA